MNKDYKHGNRNKYLLRYHLILVCKYRRHLLSANNISSDMKALAKTISDKHNPEFDSSRAKKVSESHILQGVSRLLSSF
ncbi:transposase [Lachnospiraceae bacterium C1.1]|nr:transposase [Lachnospiraceae bacterium C1.1]